MGDGSPGGVRYRAPYGANQLKFNKQTNAAKEIDTRDKQMQQIDKCNRETNATTSELSFRCHTKLDDPFADAGL